MMGVSILVFFMMRMIPGDAIDIMNANAQRSLDPAAAESLRRAFGLDRPILEQFALWFGDLLHGDLGVSIVSRRPVLEEIATRLPATVQLAVEALAIALLIAIPSGVLSATRRNSWTDFSARLVALLGLSLPNFWFAIGLIYLFSVVLRVLPPGGYASPTEDFAASLRYSLLPAFALGTAMAAITMRLTRSSLLEVLGQDYVRTARAKGLRSLTVTYRHALRAALLPVVTVVGLQLGTLLGGAVVIEQVFDWPGLGTLLLRGIVRADYPVVQGTVLFLALFVVLANLLVDLAYYSLDPRIRVA